MIIIDGTIVGVALPDIITGLKINLTDAQWVNAVYSVVFAALLLTLGKAGDRWGRKALFIAGVAIFAASSLWAGLATSGAHMIAARAAQGVGGAMILPSTLSTVNATFRGKDRAIAFGVWGAVMAGAAAVGPLLGGWLVHTFSWRAIFVINIPIAVVVIAAAIVVVPATTGRSATETTGAGSTGSVRNSLDVVGTALSAVGFGLVVFGLIEGPVLGWITPIAPLTVAGWTWPLSAVLSAPLAAFIVGGVCVAAFIAWEKHRATTGRDTILTLSLFRSRSFSWGNVTAFVVAAGEFGVVFVMPLYLVNGRGLSVMGAGWVLAGMAAGAFVSGASARHLASAIGAVATVILGVGVEAVTLVATAWAVAADASMLVVAGLLAVYGAGLGLASAQLTSTVLADIDAAKSGQGSATQSTTRQLGSATGAAAAGAALSAALLPAITHCLTGAGIQAAPFRSLITVIHATGGGILQSLRTGHIPGSPIPVSPAAAAAISHGFSIACAASLLVSAGFLILGVAGAVALKGSSTTTTARD